MYKKTVTYTNYNDETVTEDLYFHLSRAEVIKLEMSMDEGFSAYLDEVIRSGSKSKIFNAIDMLITKSYGVKDKDGKRFIKSEEILKDFTQSDAYSELLIAVFKDTDSLIEFFNGVFPKELTSTMFSDKEKIKEEMVKKGVDLTDAELDGFIEKFDKKA